MPNNWVNLHSETKVTDLNGVRKITGYAAVWDTVGSGDGRQPEVIRRGAFARALNSGKTIYALWSHDRRFPLGNTRNGTLVLREDEHGLYFEATPPDTTYWQDIKALVAGDYAGGASFGFPHFVYHRETVNGKPVLAVTEVDLEEVSPVIMPAYESTSLQLREEDTVCPSTEDKPTPQRDRLGQLLIEDNIKELLSEQRKK